MERQQSLVHRTKPKHRAREKPLVWFRLCKRACSFIDEDEHKMHCNISVTLNEIYLLISWAATSFSHICGSVLKPVRDKKTACLFKTLYHSTFQNKCVILTTGPMFIHSHTFSFSVCVFVPLYHCLASQPKYTQYLCAIVAFAFIYDTIQFLQLLIACCDKVALRMARHRI